MIKMIGMIRGMTIERKFKQKMSENKNVNNNEKYIKEERNIKKITKTKKNKKITKK